MLSHQDICLQIHKHTLLSHFKRERSSDSQPLAHQAQPTLATHCLRCRGEKKQKRKKVSLSPQKTPLHRDQLLTPVFFVLSQAKSDNPPPTQKTVFKHGDNTCLFLQERLNVSVHLSLRKVYTSLSAF